MKRGLLEIVVLDPKGNSVIRKRKMEIMLFSDIFCYAKLMRGKMKSVFPLIMKQAHRSLIEVSRNAGKVEALKLKFFSEAGAPPESIFLRMLPGEDIDQWEDALVGSSVDPNSYQEWDMRRYRAIKPCVSPHPTRWPVLLWLLRAARF